MIIKLPQIRVYECVKIIDCLYLLHA